MKQSYFSTSQNEVVTTYMQTEKNTRTVVPLKRTKVTDQGSKKEMQKFKQDLVRGNMVIQEHEEKGANLPARCSHKRLR